jgi:hypothetical protein
MAIAQLRAACALPALNRAQRRHTALCACACPRVRDIPCGDALFSQAVDRRVKKIRSSPIAAQARDKKMQSRVPAIVDNV